MSPDAVPAAGLTVQPTLDAAETPLHQVEFVVVDLETTGGSAESRITEIGAVRVRGGQRLGEFATLVNPQTPIPAFVQVLTGITDRMVAGAPPMPSVLPAFLEFAAGGVLVAHNAAFDVGFLKAACARESRPWPRFEVIDTVRLARRVLTRGEVPNCKLATLARLFRTGSAPTHRALDDARATVEVLHGLLGRVGTAGVRSLEDLTGYLSSVAPAQRVKRHLARELPASPGVYRFEDAGGQVLYIGTSRDIRARVRSYFTASEPRQRMTEMISLAERVVPLVCATRLEAQVRELRLIAEHKPHYNRRSRFPERTLWVRLTDEPYPRLSIARTPRPDGGDLGPFGSRRAAEDAVAAVQTAFPIRRCTQRLSPARVVPACALAEMGRCHAPCEGRQSPHQYAVHVADVRRALGSDASAVVTCMTARIRRLAAAGRYEEAATDRDRLVAFLRAAARMQRLSGLTGCPQLVAAGPGPGGGWEIAVVRHGRLAAAAAAPSTAAVRANVEAAVATAATVRPGPGPTPAASAEETECILRWLEAPGTRLVRCEGVWSSPVAGAGRWHDRCDRSAQRGRTRDGRDPTGGT